MLGMIMDSRTNISKIAAIFLMAIFGLSFSLQPDQDANILQAETKLRINGILTD
jgi:hypothetical protein